MTEDYSELRKKLPQNYSNCLDYFLQHLLSLYENIIECIILYGGLVRDQNAIDGWSDIDLLIVYTNIDLRDSIVLNHLIFDTQTRFNIKLDINELMLVEISTHIIPSLNYHGEYLNVLQLRENVSILVFGSLHQITITRTMEKKAALVYINTTYYQLRKYIIDNPPDIVGLKRITKWTFSIVRASLRLFDIFSHPYDESIMYITQLFKDEIDVSLLNKLLNVRNTPSESISIEYLESLFMDIPLFLEKYFSIIQVYLNNDGDDKLW